MPEQSVFDAIEALGVIHPGETLRLSARGLTKEQANQIREQVAAELPEVHVVVLCGLDVTVVNHQADT